MERAKRARKVPSREYKIEAVRLTTEGGISVTQAARDLGLNKNALHNWRRHSSLDYLSPAEHEEPALAAQESVRNSGAVHNQTCPLSFFPPKGRGKETAGRTLNWTDQETRN